MERSEQSSTLMTAGSILPWVLGAGVILYSGATSLFQMPQGAGFPDDAFFWVPAAPFAAVALVSLLIWRLSAWGSKWRSGALGLAMLTGATSISYASILFSTAERARLEDFVQTAPVAPENSYTCTRKADGGMECLNALGEPSPDYSYTIVKPKKSDP